MTSSVVSNDNLSALPKGAFSTQSSTPNLATHPDEHSLDSVMRQSQVENVSIEKSEHGNALDKSQIMTSAEVSLRKERRRKKRREKGHDAIESNDHLSAVVKDAFSTETSTAAAPPTHPDEHSLDSVMRQAQVENASKEKNVLENSLDKSQIMSGKEESLKKRRKRKRQEKGHDATKSNDNLSAVLKDALSTETSKAALAVPPTHSDEHSLDSVTRKAHVENASKDQNVLENYLDKSQIMSGKEESLKNRRKRKRQEKGHDATKSNDNLSAVLKDALSTETSKAALAVPPAHSDEHSLDSVTRKAHVENASKDQNVLENYLDKSQIMSGKEESLKKRRKRKRQEKGHDATKSNDNLSAVLKDALSTETSKAALAVPPTHSDEHSLHSVTRKSQVENASKDQNVLENYLDKSQIMSGKEVSLKKRRKGKRQEKGHDATKSNDNLSAVLKDALSTETSKAALAVPPTHSDEHSLDSVTRKAQVENASKDQNVLENYLDKSQIMSGKEVSLKKRRKGKRQEKGHDATKSNDNLSAALDNALSTETSKAALALPPTHSDEHSLDSAMRRAQVENVSKDQNVLENSSDKSQIMLGTEVRLKKREGRKKRKEKGHDATKRNGNLSAVPKDAFSIETSTAALAGPPTHLDEHSLDSVVRQSQVENASNEKNVLENASDKSQIATSVAVGSRNKGKREKRRGKGYDASESNVNKAAVPKDTLSVNTSAAAMDLPPLHSVQYPMGPVMRLSREANEEVQNIIGKATDGPTTVANEKVSLRKKNKKRKRRKTGCNDIGCVINHFEVPKDTFAPDLVMSQCQEENQGKDQNMVEKATDGSLAMPNAEVNPRKKNKRMGKRRKTRHDSLQSNVNLSGVSKGDISHSTVVSKHGHSKVSHSSLGRAISSYPKKKLLVLDLNGLLADFVLGVPEGYKPDKKIHNKSVFKRPFCDDFLQFCFDKFHVGIWSSRKRQNVDAAIKILVGVSASKLLFAWDQRQCTVTKFRTIEDKNKPLMLKELRKLWEKGRSDLPWKKGEFNEKNTLLLDDSPYKAIRNPMHTAIFPYSYRFSDNNDTSLGPGGDLRVYLEGLAMAENVQEYVASHPFGQPPITESNPHWNFYCLVRDQGLVARKRNRKRRST